MDDYKGKVIKKFRVLPEQYEYLRSLAADCNESTYQFLAHIAASTLLKLGEESEERYSPLYCKLIRDNFGRHVAWRQLQQKGIIEVKGYCQELGLSRKFKLADWVITNLLEIAYSYSFDEHLDMEVVNLMTGSLTTSKHRSLLSDDNGNQQPEVYTKAIKEIRRNGGYFNYRAVAAVLNIKRERMEKLFAEKGEEDEAYLKAQRQWQNDYYCFLSVLHQNPVPVGDNIWRYEPAYQPAKSGRAQQIGGGFQSASIEVKAAAVEGLKDCHNYDLEASQLNVLKLQFRIAGRITSWLEEYLGTDKCKEVYAEKAGLSEKTWKTCLIALMMGATMPQKARVPKKRQGRKNSVLEALWKEAEGDLNRLTDLLRQFTEVVKPLLDELALWHTWLIDEFIPNNAKFSKKGVYVMNDMGMRLYLEKLPNSESQLWKKKAQIAAFLLQGTEASYIHRLTALGPKYGFRVIGNEHDGVISFGQIPKEAQREAAELSGFIDAKLVIKPFQSKQAA